MSNQRGLSVLLVDDSALLTERLTEWVTSTEGLSLAGVVDTEQAAVNAVALGGVDLILLDLHLRTGTGFGVMRALAKFARRPVVVVLTNYTLSEFRRVANELGARYFLDKGMDMDRLSDVVSDVRATLAPAQ